MKEETITIKNGEVFLPQSDAIWMTQYEIANLFECFISKISSNIRAILKTGVLNQNKVCRMYNFKNGNSVEQYNLEMIMALSFRIESQNSEVFRGWIIKKMIIKKMMNNNFDRQLFVSIDLKRETILH
jgi:hypothetical protein